MRFFSINRANQITLGRVFLVPVFLIMIPVSQKLGSTFRLIPLFVFLVAAALDGIDGYVARKTNQVSFLGTILDPLADKLLTLSAFFVFVFMQKKPFTGTVPHWFFLIILIREFILIAGSLLLFVIKHKVFIKPRMAGKLATILEVLLIGSILGGINQYYINFLLIPVTILIALSFFLYLIDGVRQLLNLSN